MAPTSFTQKSFHFELQPGKKYTLKAFRKRYDLKPHTPATVAACSELQTAQGLRTTHFAEVEHPNQDVIQLLRVYGPRDEDGIPPLESIAVYTPQTTVYTKDDLAKALLFLHPNLIVLTAEHAPTVLNQIVNSKSFRDITFYLAQNGSWNEVVKLTDEKGDYLRDASGSTVCPNGKPGPCGLPAENTARGKGA